MRKHDAVLRPWSNEVEGHPPRHDFDGVNAVVESGQELLGNWHL